VITVTGIYYSRKEVADSITGGINMADQCWGLLGKYPQGRLLPRSACLASPYIQTNPDSTKLDNLENLPEG
jgi:hypothetical protein